MNDVKCDSCVFWCRNDKDSVLGECRKNPPAVVIYPDADYGTLWPETLETDWCGEHQHAK